MLYSDNSKRCSTGVHGLSAFDYSYRLTRPLVHSLFSAGPPQIRPSSFYTGIIQLVLYYTARTTKMLQKD